MNTTVNAIPRRVWMLWFQGISEAPIVVQKCMASWVEKNPGWDVVLLDSGNLADYITLDMPDNIVQGTTLQMRSDLVRWALLSKYGGVWADATTFCRIPLDQWIDTAAPTGFFAFYKGKRNVIMQNWFLASIKSSPICAGLYEMLRNFCVDYPFATRLRGRRRILAIPLSLNRYTRKYWCNPLVVKLFRAYPYTISFYMFEKLVHEDKDCKHIWEGTKRISADLPHLVQMLGLFSFPTKALKTAIDDSEAPLFKLTWKCNPSEYSANTLLYYSIEQSS